MQVCSNSERNAACFPLINFVQFVCISCFRTARLILHPTTPSGTSETRLQRQDAEKVATFLTWVEEAYGKPVRDLCDACIAELPSDAAFDTEQVLGECVSEYSAPLVATVERMASVSSTTKHLLWDPEPTGAAE